MLNRIRRIVKEKLLYNSYRTSAYLLAASRVNNETFTKYKDSNLGKELVLCGAGPSLKKYIPIENVKHIALNRALLNETIKYDYFIADDWLGINFMQDFLEQYDCIKFFGHQIGDYTREIPETFARKSRAERYYTDSFMVRDGFESKLVSDINHMPIGNMPNIALSALQILLFTNPKKIYLVGCDASANGHYEVKQAKEISKKQYELEKRDLKLAVGSDRVLETWRDFKQFKEAFYPDVEIVSVNPVGLKGLFKDSYQNEKGELIYE